MGMGARMGNRVSVKGVCWSCSRQDLSGNSLRNGSLAWACAEDNNSSLGDPSFSLQSLGDIRGSVNALEGILSVSQGECLPGHLCDADADASKVSPSSVGVVVSEAEDCRSNIHSSIN